MLLVKRKRNELATILLATGVKSSDVDVFSGTERFYVNHKGTGFEFKIVDNSNGAGPNYPVKAITIPKNGIIENNFHLTGHSWEQILNGFREWSTLLAEEINAPDLWSEVQNEVAFLEGSDIPNEKFSPLEIKQLEGRIALVEQQISTMAIPAGAKEAFSEIARELPKDAGLLTKKKLGELLTGQLVQQGLKWALTNEHMQTVWQAFKTFTQLFLS